MQLRMTKREPRRYRVAFAALSPPPHLVAPSPPAKPAVHRRSTAAADPNYELVSAAVAKGLVDPSDAETKLLELSMYSPEELKAYREEVEAAEAVSVETGAPPDEGMTEAELALAEFRAGGGPASAGGAMPAFTGSSSGTSKGSRDLASLAAERKAMLAQGMPPVSEYEQFEREFFGGGAVPASDVAPKRSAASVTRAKSSGAMTNLKGITRPVVTQDSQFSANIGELLANMNWTTGRRG